jgi:hypothetical protein
MNMTRVRTLSAALLSRPHRHHGLTRRQFLQAGASAAAVALAAGTGLDRPRVALAAPTAAAPRPIPYGSQFLGPAGPVFRVEAPGYPLPNPPFDTDPAHADPSTITDFNGFVGLVFVGGQGTRRDLKTGQTSDLYWEVDMRFMAGEYVGMDGRHHHGTFGFVWLDVFDQAGQQIHDFNPGIDANGLFWTMPTNKRSIDVSPGSGRAVYQETNLPMPDYHDFVSSVTGGTPVPGIVSFRIEWAKSSDMHRYRYEPNRWQGNFVTNSATCNWTGRTADAEFRTNTNNPVIFAEVGHEKSGVFFS